MEGLTTEICVVLHGEESVLAELLCGAECVRPTRHFEPIQLHIERKMSEREHNFALEVGCGGTHPGNERLPQRRGSRFDFERLLEIVVVICILNSSL